MLNLTHFLIPRTSGLSPMYFAHYSCCYSMQNDGTGCNTSWIQVGL